MHQFEAYQSKYINGYLTNRGERTISFVREPNISINTIYTCSAYLENLKNLAGLTVTGFHSSIFKDINWFRFNIGI